MGRHHAVLVQAHTELRHSPLEGEEEQLLWLNA